MICDSSGKAGQKDEQEKILYINGPCCCVTANWGPCENCGEAFMKTKPLLKYMYVDGIYDSRIDMIYEWAKSKGLQVTKEEIRKDIENE